MFRFRRHAMFRKSRHDPFKRDSGPKFNQVDRGSSLPHHTNPHVLTLLEIWVPVSVTGEQTTVIAALKLNSNSPFVLESNMVARLHLNGATFCVSAYVGLTQLKMCGCN